jgi:hypothetical protein
MTVAKAFTIQEVEAMRERMIAAAESESPKRRRRRRRQRRLSM